MYYHFKVHKSSKPYWAECIELKGCSTQADSLDDLNKNMREVLNLYLDEPNESAVLFPLPEENINQKNIVKILVDPKIAFAMLLRQVRLKNQLTQSEAAKKIGFKTIYSYQRLESSKSANPELNTIAKIKRLFPDFSLDYILQGV